MKNALSFLILMAVSTPLFCQNYRIGDLITNPDGSQGIVFHVTPDGRSGYMVALNDASNGCIWGPNTDVHDIQNIRPEDNFHYMTIFAEGDGYNNTRILREEGNASTYPAAWSVDFNGGWYLPNSMQLTMIFSAMAFIEQPLVNAGGTTLNNNTHYWSSTECSDTQAFASDFGESYNCGDRRAHDKTNRFRVRAVYTLESSPLPIIGQLMAPPSLCGEGQLALLEPELSFAEAHGWEMDSDSLFANPIAYDNEVVGPDKDGWFLRFWASNSEGIIYSNVVRISVAPTYDIHFDASACDSYEWDGITYTASGDYTHEGITARGCDSIVTCHLTLQQSYSSSFSITNCGPYFWNDIEYTESGEYEQYFETLHGCDSIVTLSLTVKSMPYASEIEGEAFIYISDFGTHTYSILPVEGAYDYAWFIDNDWSIDNPTESNSCSVNINTIGTGTLSVRVYTECGYLERTIPINHSQQPDVVIYPNPTESEASLQLVGMEGETVIIICDAIGNTLAVLNVTADLRGTIVNLPLEQYAAGTYLIQIANHYHKVVKKVVKE